MNSGNAGLYLYPSGPLNQAAYAGAALSGNATLNVVNSAAATMTLTINGGITTAAGAPAGSAFGINKTGNGTLLLTNNANGTNSVGNVASNYTGATKVTQGVLQLGANNMIPATSGLVMNGGTFNAATFSDIIGTLTAAASSTIDLGAGGTNTLKFADSQLTASSWGTGAVLTINNWDAVNSPNQNHILIGGSLQALTRNELNDIVFAGSASPHAVLVMNGADAELVPGTPLAPLKRGDLNGDGFITNADFNQLMIALTNPATYEASYPVGAPLSAGELLDVADINRDGSVNNLDMQAELYAINTGIAPGATLSGGSPANTSAVPEPGSFVLIGLGGLLLSSVARKRRSGKLVRE
jgi:autotransporter-associated beta strand protein